MLHIKITICTNSDLKETHFNNVCVCACIWLSCMEFVGFTTVNISLTGYNLIVTYLFDIFFISSKSASKTKLSLSLCPVLCI